MALYSEYALKSLNSQLLKTVGSGEAEKCRPLCTLSAGQRVWRLTSIVAGPKDVIAWFF